MNLHDKEKEHLQLALINETRKYRASTRDLAKVSKELLHTKQDIIKKANLHDKEKAHLQQALIKAKEKYRTSICELANWLKHEERDEHENPQIKQAHVKEKSKSQLELLKVSSKFQHVKKDIREVPIKENYQTSTCELTKVSREFENMNGDEQEKTRIEEVLIKEKLKSQRTFVELLDVSKKLQRAQKELL